VVCLTFTDLENTLGSVNGDTESLELLCIYSLEGHVKL
jgi:hypothetical protein